MTPIYLTPFDYYSHNPTNLKEFDKVDLSLFDLIGDKEFLLFNTGRQGILYLMEKFKLDREDEVWVTTTTESPYVSSCVTCSVFNFSKVSRVFTDKTRMIWIIHEFGFPHPRLKELIEFARQKNIPVVEDIAHSLYSFSNNKLLGTFGDYGLFSFPKNVPLPNGGLLVGNNLPTNNKYFNQKEHQKQYQALIEYLPYLPAFAEKRRTHYQDLARRFKDFPHVYSLNDEIAPFTFSFVSGHFQKIYEQFDTDDSPIELQRTHVENWITLTVNPLIEEKSLKFMADQVLETIESAKT